MSSQFKQLPAFLRDRPVVPCATSTPDRGDPTFPTKQQASDRRRKLVQQSLAERPGRAKEHALAKYSELIGADVEGNAPKLVSVPDAARALAIAHVAVLTWLYLIKGRPVPAMPKAVTSAFAREETISGLRAAGITPALADVDPNTGCVTAEALEAVLDGGIGLVSVPGLYDHAPDVEAVRALCDRHGQGFVLDIRPTPRLGWRGRHAAGFSDIAVVAPTNKAALLVVFDPMLAAIATKVRDGGQVPEPRPAWWPSEQVPDAPAVPDTAGEQTASGDVAGILIDTDPFVDRASAAVDGVRKVFDRHPDWPWKILPVQYGVSGAEANVAFVFDPGRARKPAAWETLGFELAGEWLGQGLVTSIRSGCPMPLNATWACMDLARFPNARGLSSSTVVLEGEFFLRNGAPAQLEKVMRWLDGWVDDPKVGAHLARIRG